MCIDFITLQYQSAKTISIEKDKLIRYKVMHVELHISGSLVVNVMHCTVKASMSFCYDSVLRNKSSFNSCIAPGNCLQFVCLSFPSIHGTGGGGGGGLAVLDSGDPAPFYATLAAVNIGIAFMF